MKKNRKEVKIEIVSNQTGGCVVINNYRVAGGKPWGGGTILKSWKCDVRDILDAIKEETK